MCIAGFSITENFLKTASFAIKLPAVFGEKHCNNNNNNSSSSPQRQIPLRTKGGGRGILKEGTATFLSRSCFARPRGARAAHSEICFFLR